MSSPEDPTRADWLDEALDPDQAKREAFNAGAQAAERQHRVTVPRWSQKAAQERYLVGGLSAVYPSVYGVGGLADKMAISDLPKDRWAPSLKVLKAQLQNGCIDQSTFDRVKRYAVR